MWSLPYKSLIFCNFQVTLAQHVSRDVTDNVEFVVADAACPQLQPQDHGDPVRGRRFSVHRARPHRRRRNNLHLFAGDADQVSILRDGNRVVSTGPGRRGPRWPGGGANAHAAVHPARQHLPDQFQPGPEATVAGNEEIIGALFSRARASPSGEKRWKSNHQSLLCKHERLIDSFWWNQSKISNNANICYIKFIWLTL